MQANNIDEVVQIIGGIISDTKKNENPLGYFAALYHRVTIVVKNKLGTGYFDDDTRMEKLDVIFANRYIKAYFDYEKKEVVTNSWKTTFELAKNHDLIVLQHLLLGMNAHINLDLGIAAAEISTPQNINSLENDFNRINEILSSLVNEVQENLSNIWPILKWLLKRVNGADDLIVDFSMKIARNGAWQFAKEFVTTDTLQRPQAIAHRDYDILKVAGYITNQNFFIRFLFKLIRCTELGSVSDKIESLELVEHS